MVATDIRAAGGNPRRDTTDVLILLGCGDLRTAGADASSPALRGAIDRAAGHLLKLLVVAASDRPAIGHAAGSLFDLLMCARLERAHARDGAL